MTDNFLTDSFGRRIDYLRLSVTNRCNLKCVYCTPAGGVGRACTQNSMNDGEIITLVRCFAELGIRRVRVTGGEPLMRPGIVELLHKITSIPGIENVSLSTNGMLLADRVPPSGGPLVPGAPRRVLALAHRLAGAGLGRVNISLDTLKAERFQRIAGTGNLCQVLNGMRTALKAGLHPVKLNVVVIRGMNDDEIPDFIRLTREIPVHVRFIELMPIGETGFFSQARCVPISEIRQRSGRLEPVRKHEKTEGSGPATYLRSPGALGTVGFIGALTNNFCHSCNRIRLTSTGKLLACLTQRIEGTDLGTMVRSGRNPKEIKAVIQMVIQSKPRRHQMSVQPPPSLHPSPLRGEGRVRVGEGAIMCSVGG